MNKRMLIDTSHAEETRVVVMDGNRLEDYDVETSAKKQLKGNIYLAKVIRVEPSLQAAFVEYGGNRHGFLAFSEIHPDYYQIPVADREKLLALQDEEARAEEARAAREDDEEGAGPDDVPAEDAAAPTETEEDDHTAPETVGGEHDTGDEGAAQRRTARFLRNYKIQEVIRRRQIILVQVVKEERGNKGAALTTYVSLAGRYCVLMPNALRGGGVSRKITAVADRKRLRETISALNLPRGMSMIVRTAGAQRPQQEITRDCEYLLNLWDDIREHTITSVAPTLVYEEASLIKRAIRDVYTRDIEEIVVDGEKAWKSAREFMRLLMPHSTQKVHLWKPTGQSLFAHYQVEGHLDAMFLPTAQLRSGGYLVINQTEALVSIDVNSGRSTRERNIEETALRTNLEAADEVARQLRLRDLAGLIVIDFIDMESRKHNAMVERRLKDALRSDRARIQVGSISHFGLMEMSRQRLRPSIAESVFTTCPHCQGTGIIRGTESAALHVLRAIEEEGGRRKAAEIQVNVASAIALYILNHKREWLTEIERRHHMLTVFIPDDSLLPPEFRIERSRAQTRTDFEVEAETVAVAAPSVREIPIMAEHPPVVETEEAEAEPVAETGATVDAASPEGEERRKRRRRRRRRGNRRDDQNAPDQASAAGTTEDNDEDADDDTSDDVVAAPAPVAAAPQPQPDLMPGRRRTRSRRRPGDRGTSDQDTGDRAVAQERAPEQRAWRGPTPANPFGEDFDIFDVIDRNEQQAGQRTAPVTEVRVQPEVVAVIAPASPAPQPLETLATDTVASAVEVVTIEAQPIDAEIVEEPVKKPTRRRGRKPAATAEEAPAVIEAEVVEAAIEDVAVAEAAPAPARRRRTAKSKAVAEPIDVAEAEAVAEVPAEPVKKPVRRRTKAAIAAEEVAAEPEVPVAEKKPRARRATKPKVDSEAPIQPIIIDDTPPPTRRTGWWKK